MASQWMLDAVNQTLQNKGGATPPPQAPAQPTPTPQPSFAPQQSQPAQMKFSAPQATPVNTNPHGKFFSGNLLSKAMDVLQLPYYAIASYDKGQENALNQMKADAKRSGQSAFQKFGINLFGNGILGGLKNIPSGIENRTQIGTEPGDYNGAKYLTSNKYAQSGINTLASFGAPSLPVGKVFSFGGKVLSEVPAIAKVANSTYKFTNAAIDAARANPTIANAVEKIPFSNATRYFRNPEVGKILETGKANANQRVSSLYHTINDMATGLSPAERVKVGNLIEGGVITNANRHLAQRAQYIKEISDQIGKELVDLGVMSKESFDKYKGQYLSHIADVVKNTEAAKTANTGGVRFFTNSLKQRGNKLGRNGLPDYVREFQFPTFKALSGEVVNAEHAKAIKQIADKYGTIAEDQIAPNELSKELVNTMLKDRPKTARPGLGDIRYEQTYAYKENPGQQIVDLLRSKLPSISNKTLDNGKKVRMGSKMIAENNIAKDISGTPEITGLSTPNYSYPSVKGTASIPGDVQGAEARLGKVGSLPQKQVKPQLMNVVDEKALTRDFGGGVRTTKDGKVALEDLLPPQIGKQFKGVVVPSEVADYIKRTYKNTPPNILDKAINLWKLGKTIYSGPGYHARNIMSNIILADMATGAGVTGTARNYIHAANAIKGKVGGKMGAYLQELKDAGVIGRTGMAEGIKELKPSEFGQGKSTLRKIIDKPKNFQGAAEDAAKLNVYSILREKGLGIEEAAKKAEEAIFSPYRISSQERGLVRGAIPFYSFTRQALPLTVKTALNHPDRLTKYAKIKTGIESLSPNDTGNNQKLPANLEGQIRLPIKDKNGNNAYFDPTYIYPFGNFGDAGNPLNGGSLPFGLSVNPFVQEAAQQAFNKDSYFGQPIAKSNIPARANAQRVQHAYQTFAPNLMPTDLVGGIPTGQPNIPLVTRGGSKLFSAFTNAKDYAGRTRSKAQAVADTFGLKSAFYDAPTQAKFDNINKQKILKSINSEYISTIRDQRLSPQDKRKIIKDLLEQRRKVLIGK